MDPIKAIGRRAYKSIPFRQPLFELIRTALQLPERVYRHLHFEGPFAVPIDEAHGFRMMSQGNVIENELFWSGYGKTWEAASLRIWAALCRDRAGAILDIGANTGVYALAAKSMAPNARVIALEPVPRMAAKLRTNVAINGGQIEVVEKAISDRSGEMMICDNLADHNYSASLEGQGPDAVCYPVKVCSIDDFLASDWPTAVGPIKIDIERHEPAAVRGMAETLRRYQPPILIEVLDAAIGRDVELQVEGLGYEFFHVDEAKGLVPASHLAPLREQHWNHLLCTAGDFEAAGLKELLAR